MARTKLGGAWVLLDPDAALVAAPRASVKRLVVFIASHQRQRDEPQVQSIVAEYAATCERLGIDPLIAVAQLIVETEALTSPSSYPPQLDPLGVAPSGFESWSDVAAAHAGLLLAFALRPGAENAAQRDAIRAATRWRDVSQLRGAAPTLDRLGAVWGRDVLYADRIREVADLVTQPQW